LGARKPTKDVELTKVDPKVLERSIHASWSCQLFVENSNRTQRRGRDNHDIVAP
jgi:hypothetical protein